MATAATSSELVFDALPAESADALLSVRNATSAPLAFKLHTSDKARLQCGQPVGFLAAGQSAGIPVHWSGASGERGRGHNLQMYTLPAPDEAVEGGGPTASDFWRQMAEVGQDNRARNQWLRVKFNKQASPSGGGQAPPMSHKTTVNVSEPNETRSTNTTSTGASATTVSSHTTALATSSAQRGTRTGSTTGATSDSAFTSTSGTSGVTRPSCTTATCHSYTTGTDTGSSWNTSTDEGTTITLTSGLSASATASGTMTTGAPDAAAAAASTHTAHELHSAHTASEGLVTVPDPVKCEVKCQMSYKMRCKMR